eukprot:3941930-Rhodomonas_salina.7
MRWRCRDRSAPCSAVAVSNTDAAYAVVMLPAVVLRHSPSGSALKALTIRVGFLIAFSCCVSYVPRNHHTCKSPADVEV